MPKTDPAPTTTSKATAAKDVIPAAPAALATSDTKPDAPQPKTTEPRTSTCVVNDGRGMHVGGAVNGLVCSYHAMHYDAKGNRR